jgi:hypothetical protein
MQSNKNEYSEFTISQQHTTDYNQHKVNPETAYMDNDISKMVLSTNQEEQNEIAGHTFNNISNNQDNKDSDSKANLGK